MQVNNNVFNRNKKFAIVVLLGVLIVGIVAIFFFFRQRGPVPKEGEIISPKAEVEVELTKETVLPDEVGTLLQDSLDEAFEDIEALGL